MDHVPSEPVERKSEQNSGQGWARLERAVVAHLRTMTDPDAAHVLALYFGAGEVGHRAPYVRFTRSVAAAATRVEVSGPDTVSARCEPSARRTVHRLMPLGWKGADDVDANLYREVADADLDVVVRQAIGALRDDSDYRIRAC